jgi:hypothetical protein
VTAKQKIPSSSNTQIGSSLRTLGVFLMLAGCVPAHQIEKTRNDAAIYGEQRRAREARERCIDKGAMPGTTAYLECQLKSGK